MGKRSVLRKRLTNAERIEMTKVLCARMRRDRFVKDECDGQHAVCGWCMNTVEEINKARLDAALDGEEEG